MRLILSGAGRGMNGRQRGGAEHFGNFLMSARLLLLLVAN